MVRLRPLTLRSISRIGGRRRSSRSNGRQGGWSRFRWQSAPLRFLARPMCPVSAATPEPRVVGGRVGRKLRLRNGAGRPGAALHGEANYVSEMVTLGRGYARQVRPAETFSADRILSGRRGLAHLSRPLPSGMGRGHLPRLITCRGRFRAIRAPRTSSRLRPLLAPSRPRRGDRRRELRRWNFVVALGAEGRLHLCFRPWAARIPVGAGKPAFGTANTGEARRPEFDPKTARMRIEEWSRLWRPLRIPSPENGLGGPKWAWMNATKRRHFTDWVCLPV